MDLPSRSNAKKHQVPAPEAEPEQPVGRSSMVDELQAASAAPKAARVPFPGVVRALRASFLLPAPDQGGAELERQNRWEDWDKQMCALERLLAELGVGDELEFEAREEAALVPLRVELGWRLDEAFELARSIGSLPEDRQGDAYYRLGMVFARIATLRQRLGL
jgi:hypothetical protein